MSSTDTSKSSQWGKRRQPGTTSSPRSESPYKKHKSAEYKTGVKPDPQPVRSDLLSVNASKSGSNRQSKNIAYLDLTGDTSDEPDEEDESSSALRKKLTELTLERDDYRKSLHDANAKINRIEADNLLRKARDFESEKRETAAAALEQELQKAKETINQLAKAKTDLDEKLRVKNDDAIRLEQSLDQQIAEFKRSVNREQVRLQETLDKQQKEREQHKRITEDLQKQLKANTEDSERMRKSLSEQVMLGEQLTKDKSNLSKQVKAKETLSSRLQEVLDRQKQKNKSDVQRFKSSETQHKNRLEEEVAKTIALAKARDDLETLVEEQESRISRLRMEVGNVKCDLEEQKEVADWYKAKFLKFKGWFYKLEKESQEKSAAVRRILPKIYEAAGLIFDHSKLIEELDVVEGVRADESSPKDRPLDEPHAL
ncbi:hypothetical protein N0V82_007251 [Gnomoniopsis sp. IMI 355080]|nr:hypothetical protein N0V82_007251 [Gnomoniopsis sp. IMI 355080]